MKTVIEFQDYKRYLDERLQGKGKKTEFAKAIGCQTSFLSQVLRGKPDLSLEQGVVATEYLGHSESDAKYFMLLLQYGRASSKRLRDFFQREIALALKEREKISKRITASKEVAERDRATYYSSWIYSALHVLCSIEDGNQAELFAEKTKLRPEELHSALHELVKSGILNQRAGRYSSTERRVHVPNSDPLVLNHHRNFRLRALEELKYRNEQSLHYSILTAISVEDGAKLKEMILAMIADADRVIKPSREESVFQLNLDFFEI